MKWELRITVGSLVLLTFLILMTVITVYGNQHESHKGMETHKAVFDMRAGDAKMAAVFLGMIQQTFQNENLNKGPDKPEFVVVFIGPSVKLISTATEGFSAEEKAKIEEIASTITEMSRDGIKLEICLAAAHLLGVDPETILPEIKQVQNGWVTLIAHQAMGYSLVPVY